MILFADLPSDCHHDVLKYVRTLERIKLERVNSQWRAILAGVWSSQKALIIVPYNLDNNWNSWFNADLVCRVKSHKCYEPDLISFRENHRKYPSFSNCVGLLERCTNLRALYWFGKCSEAFSDVLVKLSPVLEHLEFHEHDNAAGFEHFEPGPAFRCLSFENQEVNSVKAAERSRKIMISLLDKAINLRSFKFNCRVTDEIMQEIIKKATQLEDLHVLLDKKRQEELGSPFAALKSIRSYGLEIGLDSLNSWPKLCRIRTRISWSIVNENLFAKYLDNNAANLRSLILFLGIPSDGFLDLLSRKTPNLEHLELEGDQYDLEDVLSEKIWLAIGQFRRLRKIQVSKTEITAEGLELALKTAPKLNEINLSSITRLLGIEVWPILSEYGLKYPKRVIKVNIFAKALGRAAKSQLPPNLRI